MNKEKILNILKNVKINGEKLNIVDNNRIINIKILNKKIIINIAIDNPAMHIKKQIEYDIIKIFNQSYNYDYELEIIFLLQKKNINKYNEISNIKNIIVVASGKGGVGKSTIAANLSISLNKMNFKVGLIDADIYGPSIPIMFNIENAKPKLIEINGKKKMEPISMYDIKILSIGFFAESNQAILWRGPMAVKALRQIIHDSNWGNLDFLIIDLPPGTGDIHISIVQELYISGAIIISTPQKIAISDVRKAVAMFKYHDINVPILGIIENMSYYTPIDYPNKKYFIFGENGVKNFSKELEIPFLGEIPIIENICKSSDKGSPFLLNKENKNYYNIYNNITKNIIKELEKRNNILTSTKFSKK